MYIVRINGQALGVPMIVSAIAIAWVLLAGFVCALCRAARLGDGSQHLQQPARGRLPKNALADGSRAMPGTRLAGERMRIGRRPGDLPSNAARAAFTKSLRRRAGLHRA
jgi:hypothetical protein